MNITMKKGKALAALLIVAIFSFMLPQYTLAAPLLQQVSYNPNQAAGELILQFSQALNKAPSSFFMGNQKQVVFDFSEVTNVPTSRPYAGGVLRQVDFIAGTDGLRMIIGLAAEADYTSHLSADKKTVTVQFTYSKTKAAPIAGAEAEITAIDFKQDKTKNSGTIIVSLDKKAKTAIVDSGDAINVTFSNTRTQLLKTYNTRAYGTPVEEFMLTYNAMKKETVLQIKNKGLYTQNADQSGNQFRVEIAPQEKQVTKQGDTLYKGERISLNFQDISVRAVLQLLSDFTGMNMIVSDSVTGNLTLRLQQVPWDQALDFILRSQSLSKRTMGNIMIIGPSAEIALQEQAELKAQQDLETLAPLYTETFTINYGNAKDYVALLNAPENSLLSPRGRAVMLNTTNQIIVEDTATKLKSIRDLFRQADLPAKQVQIEARIVFVRKGFEQDLGVKWDINNTNKNQYFRGFGMDLSAADVAEGVAAPHLALGKILGSTDINLELSALEAISKADIVSSPRLLTSNNQPATIEQGAQIAFRTQSPSGGTTVELVPALLKLSVTPQITPNNKLLLALEVKQDKPIQLKGQNEPAGIDTRKVATNILVNNGQTVVLGGVYEIDQQKTVTRVPLLGSIPLVGALFRNTTVVDNQTELLIFLTPRIIETDAK